MTDPAPRRLVVARVARPHGLRGQVVVEMLTNRPERLAPGSVLHSAVGPVEITASGPAPGTGDRWLISVAGVSDKAGAERLRGQDLLADALADPDALWVHELIGSRVETGDGTVVGTVTAVEANPASDLLVLDTAALIPLRFVIDHAPGLVVVDVPAGLLDL